MKLVFSIVLVSFQFVFGCGWKTAKNGSVSQDNENTGSQTSAALRDSDIKTLEIDPASPLLFASSTLPLKAIATLADETKVDVTSSVVWNSADKVIVSFLEGNNGKIKGINPGTTNVIASMGSRKARATVIVNPYNSWNSVSSVGAPSAVSGQSVIWTGSKMIVWGGGGTNSGGVYDPATDIWTATTKDNAPSSRSGHTAIWTGSKMFVWGGWSDATNQPLNTGALYDPTTNSWTAISTAQAPSARVKHTAVWTGTKMIVWGGSSHQLSYDDTNTGAAYDPGNDTWTALATLKAPDARQEHSAVWTGSKMVIWGGLIPNSGGGGLWVNTGGQYDPSTDSWTPTSLEAGVPQTRGHHTAVWTGSKMVICGGQIYGSTSGVYSAVYDVDTDFWLPTPSSVSPNDYVPPASHSLSSVWTGTRVIVWGGLLTGPAINGAASNQGGVFDPSTFTWTPTAISPATPSPRANHTAIWTGSSMLIWGGDSGGGSYTP